MVVVVTHRFSPGDTIAVNVTPDPTAAVHDAIKVPSPGTISNWVTEGMGVTVVVTALLLPELLTVFIETTYCVLPKRPVKEH